MTTPVFWLLAFKLLQFEIVYKYNLNNILFIIIAR